ncbi:glucose inhibited division A family protein, partial [Chlamydia psittaci 84-8471/1]
CADRSMEQQDMKRLRLKG